MRWVVWCAACSLLACGKSHDVAGGGDSENRGGQSTAGSTGLVEMGGGAGHEPAGGSPGSGGAGSGSGGANGGAGSGGMSPTDGGRGPSNAGASGALSAGSAGSGGFAGAPAAGNGGTSSLAGMSGAASGSSGAAGAPPAMCTPYIACGCGCCDNDVAASNACYYPDRGDTREKLISDDAARATDPTCVSTECQSTHYWCCVPPAEVQPDTYRTDSSHSDAGDRVVVIGADPDDNCTAFALSSTLEPPKFPIDVPTGWHIEVASTDFKCSTIYNFPQWTIAIGAEGFVRFSAPDQCAVDFNVTLYFMVGTDGIKATHLVGQGVPTPNVGTSCN